MFFDEVVEFPDGRSKKDAAPDARTWRWLDLAAASEVVPPPFHLNDKAISRQAITMFAGRRGVGKTYLTLKLAHSIALGRFFGPYKTLKSKVLYISQEMSESAMRRRINRLFRAEDLKAVYEDATIICKAPGIKLDSNDGATRLASLISANGPCVVFLDALRYLKGKYRENDNDEMGEMLERLSDKVAVPTDSPIVLLHHMGKPKEDGSHGGGRGASAIEDVCADVVYLTREKGGSLRIGEFDKTRDGAGESTCFAYRIETPEKDPDNPQDDTVEIDIFEHEKASNDDFEVGRLNSLLREEGGGMLRTVIEKRLGWTTRSAARHIRRAVTAQSVMTSGGRKGIPQTVTLI